MANEKDASAKTQCRKDNSENKHEKDNSKTKPTKGSSEKEQSEKG